MKLNTPILDLKGNPVEGDLTVAQVAMNALLLPFQDEANLPGAEKVKRFQLSMKISANEDDVSLTAEEITTIKNCVAKGYPALVVGRVWEVLDPNDK
jgi:hypothetical protein